MIRLSTAAFLPCFTSVHLLNFVKCSPHKSCLFLLPCSHNNCRMQEKRFFLEIFYHIFWKFLEKCTVDSLRLFDCVLFTLQDAATPQLHNDLNHLKGSFSRISCSLLIVHSQNNPALLKLYVFYVAWLLSLIISEFRFLLFLQYQVTSNQ